MQSHCLLQSGSFRSAERRETAPGEVKGIKDETEAPAARQFRVGREEEGRASHRPWDVAGQRQLSKATGVA